MKRTLFIIIGVAMLLVACSDGRTAQMLSQIDTLMNDHPDSALAKLDSLKAEKANWPKNLRMRFDLLEAKAQNKAFVDFTTDSIAKEFTRYYDNHGTPNERMLAHYLLGCAYRDLGEAPMAVDCYLDAISKADTTALDCDNYTLMCLYAQLSEIYHQQFLLSYEIDALRKASLFAQRGNDVYYETYFLEKSASSYLLMNRKDSAEIIYKRCIDQYSKHNFEQRALQTSTKLLYLYVEDNNKLADAKLIMDKYESRFELFDEQHNLPPSKRQYFFTKGKYYEGINKLDSAVFYYRMGQRPHMTPIGRDPIYKGLLSVYTKLHYADSIAKYAKLYCEANDSSIAKKDQELTAQMAASYNYNRFQKIALENERKASKIRLTLICLVIVISIIAYLAYRKWVKSKIEKEKLIKQKEEELAKLKSEYTSVLDNYKKNLDTLQLLDSTHKEIIATIQHELDSAKGENKTYRVKYHDVNTMYENTKRELTQENEALKDKMSELERQEVIRQGISKTQSFIDTDIVKRIKVIETQPLTSVTEIEWKQLISTASNYYPALLHDLNDSTKITQQEIRACLLVCLSIRESDIARILDISAQRVTNIKISVNKELFGDKSARSLYKNLTLKYEIFTAF